MAVSPHLGRKSEHEVKGWMQVENKPAECLAV